MPEASRPLAPQVKGLRWRMGAKQTPPYDAGLSGFLRASRAATPITGSE